MASLIEKIGKQALNTFSTRTTVTTQIFEENFAKLRALADQLTAADVNLNMDVFKPIEPREIQPPVTYIDILEDRDVTIGIFVLQSGAKLPLHDHPHMYGILKVMAGTVKIQSYTIISNSQEIGKPCSADEKRLFSAVKTPELTVNEKSESCYLTPTERNVHEIYSVGGAAAFLDILSPPYDTGDVGERSCHYFKEQNSKRAGHIPNIINLMNIPSPPEYWSNTAPYKGPRLRRNDHMD